MPLSARAEYACLAMLELARAHRTHESVQARRISEEHEIPAAFLLQVLQQLRRSGLVISERGPGGGFRLARGPDSTTIADVLDACDAEPSGGVADPTSSMARRVLTDVYRLAERAKRDSLSSQSLSLLCDAAFPDAASWSI